MTSYLNPAKSAFGTGTPVPHTHDHQYLGTKLLLAVSDAATGEIIGRLKRHHRSAEFVEFLRAADEEITTDRPVHLIMDNYAAHNTYKLKTWLAAHPRY